ncbi:DUF998 domain-containing protein [Microlunatus speluncae]|uniref:DUF998 domain-containing protein n=1 Tax=Microlunatus speluncae TaxID=2594267 RepID=UPI001375A73E|nr:DUF998 domain-containing protein [Microlunatus speluncae]
MRNGNPGRPVIAGVTLRNSQAIGLTLAVIAPMPVLIGQFTGTGLDPLHAPISQYVYLPGGYQLVLFGALLMAGCGATIAIDLLRRSGGPPTRDDHPRRLAGFLLLTFAVAFSVVGLVPTDPPGSANPSATELVHRASVIWTFVALPAAGIVLARSPRLVGLRGALALQRLAVALLVGVLVFGAIQLPLLIAGSGIPALGLVERLAFAFMIGYLIVLTMVVRAGPVSTGTVAPVLARSVRD